MHSSEYKCFNRIKLIPSNEIQSSKQSGPTIVCMGLFLINLTDPEQTLDQSDYCSYYFVGACP